MKLKQNRNSIKFDYEFLDGSIEKVVYKAPTTKQLRTALQISEKDINAQLDFTVNTLKECLESERVNEIIAEQEEANIFDFKELLDLELGKQKKQR